MTMKILKITLLVLIVPYIMMDDFCGPGTKWIDGNCVSSYDGMKEACIKARPGWEWTCETSKVCEDKN